MMGKLLSILPLWGRGTAPDLIRGGGAGQCGAGRAPSVSAARCHLPQRGRIG